MCRRIANLWANEYNGLRPVADLVRQLQNSISFWLNDPAGWTRQPENEAERQAAINEIRRKVYIRIHKLAEDRLIISHARDWRIAFESSGTGSSNQRAKEMDRIYNAAAPSIIFQMAEAQEFTSQVFQLVKDAIQESGGSLQGV